jgi:glycosyltransferase involved in cell wall biosynthesis
VIEDQKTGVLVPIGDVQHMARAVIDLLSNSEIRRAIATQAAQSAAKKFSLKRMVDEIEKIYAAD